MPSTTAPVYLAMLGMTILSFSVQIIDSFTGTGLIGTEFLLQLQQYISCNPLRPLITIYIARSTHALIAHDYSGLNLSTWITSIAEPALSTPGGLFNFLQSAPGPVILLDNTAVAPFAYWYPSFLRAGIHIISPDKKAYAQSLSLFRELDHEIPKEGASKLPSARDYPLFLPFENSSQPATKF